MLANSEAVVMIYFKLFRRMQKLKKYWLNMLILNHFRLNFDKTNEKCGDNLYGEKMKNVEIISMGRNVCCD